MIDPSKYPRNGGESEDDYKNRICELREVNRWRWDETAYILNVNLGYDYSESKYRKDYAREKAAYYRGLSEAEGETESVGSGCPVGPEGPKGYTFEFNLGPKVSPGDPGPESYSLTDEDIALRERYSYATEKVPYYRLMRQDSRFERFYSLVGEQIKRLPPPDFLHEDTHGTVDDEEFHDFVMTLADLHIGACFESVNNSYSMAIAKERFNLLLGRVSKFVNDHNIETLKILSLGDVVQGILRISDLKLNEAPVVDAFVFAMRLIADFLNKLSTHCYIQFYQVCYSNHDQLRPLGTKASELAAEDLGKILYAYLRDTLENNQRIEIIADTEHDYLEFSIFDFNCIAMHGHQINNVATVSKDLATRHRKFFDYVFLGHTHSAKEFIASAGKHHNLEILVSSSIVGEDNYSDKLMLSSKASVKIFEFDRVYGHVASYNIILN